MQALRLQIVLLAIAMGLQAVVGQMAGQPVDNRLHDHAHPAGRRHYGFHRYSQRCGIEDIRVHITLVASYLAGALLAGLLTLNGVKIVVFLPLIGVAIAFARR